MCTITFKHFFYLSSILLALLACSQNSPMYQPCQSDEDCRDGYECNQEDFKGECVQRRRVISCGEELCMYPEEKCENLTCVVANIEMGGESAGMESAGVSISGTENAGTGSAGMEVAGVDIAGTDNAGTDNAGTDNAGTDNAGADNAGTDNAGIEVAGVDTAGTDTLGDIEIQLIHPAEQQLFLPQSTIRIQGQVTQERREDWSQLQVNLQVSSQLTQGSDTITHHVEISDDGMFSYELSLDPDVYQLRAYIQTTDDEAWTDVKVRVDTFVQAEQFNLIYHENHYQYLGVHLNDLIPALHQIENSRQKFFLNQIFEHLHTHGVNVIRLFVGWTHPQWGILNEDYQLNEAGINLLDKIIAHASMNGLKTIMVFMDAHQEYETVHRYLQWHGFQNPTSNDEVWMYQTGVAFSYVESLIQQLPQHQNHINGLVYADDPGILGWEIVHQPNWRIFNTDVTLLIHTFFEQTLTLLEQSAPLQLHWTGEQGLDYNQTPYGMYANALQQYQLAHLFNGSWGGAWDQNARSLSHHIQSFTFDPWVFFDRRSGFEGDWLAVGQNWIRSHALANVTHMKPLSLQLLRLNQDQLDHVQRLNLLTAWAQEMRSQGLVGMILGDFSVSDDPIEGVNDTQNSIYTHSVLEMSTLEWIQLIAQRFLGN